MKLVKDKVREQIFIQVRGQVYWQVWNQINETS